MSATITSPGGVDFKLDRRRFASLAASAGLTTFMLPAALRPARAAGNDLQVFEWSGV